MLQYGAGTGCDKHQFGELKSPMLNTHEYIIFDPAKLEPALAMRWPGFRPYSASCALANRHNARNVIDQQFPLRQQFRPKQRQFSVVADHLCRQDISKPLDVADE